MVSPRAAQNEERRLSVRIVQHLPAAWVRARRSRSRVIACESNGERIASCFLENSSTVPSMVSIRAHALGHGHAPGIENRGDRSRYRADIRLYLADVMKERCLDGSGVTR